MVSVVLQMVILLNLNKSKMILILLICCCSWMAAPKQPLLTLSLCKSPLGEPRCLGNPYFVFAGCLSIQFFDSPPFSQHNQLGHLWLPTPHCAATVTYQMPCHCIGHQARPTQPLPREVEDFPRGERYFKHVPLLTCIMYLSPKEVYWQILFKNQNWPATEH